MLNLIKKDFLLTFSTKASLFIIILYIPFMNLLMGTSEPERMIGLMIISLVYLLTIIPLSYDNRGKSHILMQSLPIKRRDIVISKYISICINFILGVIIIVGYLWILSLFGLRTVDSLSFSLIMYTLVVLILSLSISLPIQIRAPLKIANFTNGFIMANIMGTLRIEANGFGSMFNNKNTMEPKLLFIIAIVAYLVSMTLSIWMYEEQELI